jgi:hypothetical protein
MATYEPDPDLLRIQLDSIRAQSHRWWICVISDDGSSAAGRAAIAGAVGGDPRFIVDYSASNRGFYANFERALRLAPASAQLIALCDQDDRWYPDKLASLVALMGGGVTLAYGDMRIVDDHGRVLSDTYWNVRRNNYADFASLMIANTVTGAASLFDQRLLADALPFPPPIGRAFHDHWIAKVALASGRLAYEDRPLHDYVQHTEAALGHVGAHGSVGLADGALERARAAARGVLSGPPLRWWEPYFDSYCRMVQSAAVLQLRLGERLDPYHRELLAATADPRSAARWLVGMAVRGVRRRSPTLGRERAMLAGLAWRGYQGARVRVSSRG